MIRGEVQLFSGTTDEKMAVFQWGVVIGASLIAAGYDLREGRIPNVLTGPLLVTGLIWATWMGGLAGLLEAAGACALLALPYVLLFLFAHGGAGDAKLMGAIGAWLGLTQGVTVLVCVVAAGMVVAIAKAITQKRLKFVLTSVLLSFYGFILSFYAFILFLTGHKTTRPATSNRTDIEQSEGLGIPYGVAIFAGVCAAGGIVWLL